jgi:hypothetical protein
MPGKSLFPAVPIDEAQEIARTIAQKNAGQPMRRLDVFEELGKSPTSGPSRLLVTASGGFGLTTGSYNAEMLALTELGRRLAVDDDSTAMIDAVLNVEVFRKFFEGYKGNVLPSDVAARSFLANAGIPTDRTEACWDLIRQNGEQCGLIRELGKALHVLSREHAIERMGLKPGEAVSKVRPTGRRPAEEMNQPTPIGFPSLNINLEIHLPADVRPEVYDAIFSSMRKHLIDGTTVESR